MNEPSGTAPGDRVLGMATRPGDADLPPAARDANAAAASAPAGDVASASHAGAVLARARAARHLTVEQIAQRIKVAPRQVEAIEAARWADFHTPAILRGFVRAYAKAVDIDGTPLLAELPRIEVTPGQLTGVASVGRAVGGRHGLNGLGWWFTWGLVAVALVALAIALPRIDVAGWISAREAANGLATPPAAGTPSATPSVSEAPAEARGTADPGPTMLTPPATTVAPDAAAAPGAQATPTVPGQLSAPVPLQPAPGNAVAANPAGVAQGNPPQAATNPAGVSPQATPPQPVPQQSAAPTPAGSSRLKLDFDRETWIEIRDASGKIVSTGVSTAGASVNAEGKPPFKIIIGNVPGTRFAVDGRNVDLAPFSVGNVARFTYPPEARQ